MSEIINKISFHGTISSVQPRIRLLRSYDQRDHAYLGYSLRIRGIILSQEREFLIGIGKGTQAKNNFQTGYQISGECLPVSDPVTETVEFYKVSKLKITGQTPVNTNPPPWVGIPLALEVYRARGHRRLDVRTYTGSCLTCIWGCNMAVEMIIDHWNPEKKRYRFETFCYGPKSCRLYKSGPTRKVPGRKGKSWEEEDWVDEESTCHRQPDE